MSQKSENLTPGSWAGWSTISPNNNPSFTIWLTGLPGTGKTTLALFLKKALVTRGYNVEIIDTQTLSYWMNLELQLKEELCEDTSQDYPERSTMHLISYLEQHSYLAPLWEDIDTDDEEIAIIKTRLQAMGYLD